MYRQKFDDSFALKSVSVNTKFERYLTLIPNNSQKRRFRKSCNIHADIPNNMTKMESVQHLCQSGELVDT